MGQKEVASIAALGGISVAVATYYLLSRPKTLSTSKQLPTTMRRLIVSTPHDDLEQVQITVQQDVPLPSCGPGRVLVQMQAVPVVRIVLALP